MNRRSEPDAPFYGATPTPTGVEFTVWAPGARDVVVVADDASGSASALEQIERGLFQAEVAGLAAGARYRYRIDDRGPWPDPASRFQPDGVHGPSEVIDPTTYDWTDRGWRGVGLEDLVVYEVHVGTFSPEGTFRGATRRLAELRDLGVTAIELMPVADFAGARNWGYDGVALFAPSHSYGRPDDLRALVDAAHRIGLAVLVDVVYNHLGPDGAYLRAVAPAFFSSRHTTPWGDAVNFDGPDSGHVRRFVEQNAAHWVREYHVDGLRLDATHALVDDGPRHILAELAATARDAAPERRVLVVAEDHRNLAALVRPEADGGYGLDGVWADDWHHEMRRALAGDAEGYFRDFSGTTHDIARTLEKGWFFCGQEAEAYGGPRGTEPTGVRRRQALICLQNHDQIGNRAHGDRLHHAIDLDAYDAASVLLLCAPETPLLFMGQEWAASSPFQYFTDHHDELGRLVTEGRRREFSAFSAFRDAASRAAIPDPQAASTFERSRLDWRERDREPHAGTLRLYRRLLALRPSLPPEEKGVRAMALDDATVGLQRGDGPSGFVVIARLRGAGRVLVPGTAAVDFEVVLDSAAIREPKRPGSRLVATAAGFEVGFERPGGVVLRARASTRGVNRPRRQ